MTILALSAQTEPASQKETKTSGNQKRNKHFRFQEKKSETIDKLFPRWSWKID